MEILGIGPSEVLFVVVLALIILGPREMQKTGRTIGKWLRQVVTSDGWKFFQQTSREIQTLPNRLMRDAALEELKEMEKDLRQPLQADPRAAKTIASPATAPSEQPTPDREVEPKILPSPQTPSPVPEDREPNA
jgi:sec-independent protein translocase protein TatB